MAAARTRRIDVVVVWKIDRWGRSIQHFVSSVQELATLGVRFIVPTQGIDTDTNSPGGKLQMNILASFAEFERDLIVERTMAGLATARKAGRVGGRPRKILLLDKVRLLHAQGWSTRKIAAHIGGVSHWTIADILKRKQVA
jgi:DNA invertase Pin-like site-specific DNA recombinase